MKADALKTAKAADLDVTLYGKLLDAAAKAVSGDLSITTPAAKEEAILRMADNMYTQYRQRGTGKNKSSIDASQWGTPRVKSNS
jgi:hypothetical protein